MKAIFSLIQRDWIESLRYKPALLMDSASTCFQILTFFFVGQLLAPGISHNPDVAQGYFPFALIGITFSMYLSTALISFSGAIGYEQENGTLEPLLLAAPLPNLLIAAAIRHFFYTTLRIAIWLSLGCLLGKQNFLSAVDPIAVFALAVLTFTSLAGLGLASAGFVLRYKRGDPISFIIFAFSRLLSGVYFPVTLLPGAALKISSFLPLTYSLRGIRKVLLESATIWQIRGDLMTLLGFSLILLPAGYLYLKWSFDEARLEGILGFR